MSNYINNISEIHATDKKIVLKLDEEKKPEKWITLELQFSQPFDKYEYKMIVRENNEASNSSNSGDTTLNF